MSTITARLERLERAATGGNGFCPHSAFIRMTGDATDEERRRTETAPVCEICNLPRVAGINVILPAKMTREAWAERYAGAAETG